ncbi:MULTISPECIES: hypothetical protein [Acidithiobacillus]|uniref:hypothetical protein n=1 Tax=Acidithiobacillus TaxID=119977 RepID=UPI0004E108FC|nr:MULTISPECIES: hypothetical protein [Acidithiobacillus]
MDRVRSAAFIFAIFILSFPWYPVWWFTIIVILVQFGLGAAIVFNHERLRFTLINLIPHREPYQKRMRLKVGRHRHADYGIPKQTFVGIIEEDL